jgi:transcriptional regulator GlxA family with amidase domain
MRTAEPRESRSPAAPPGVPPPRRIVLLAYDGVQTLDVTGPYEVFAGANRLAASCGGAPPYVLEIVAPRARRFRTSSGLDIAADRALGPLPAGIDTLVVAGGAGALDAAADRAVTRWIARAASRARRVASVCTGAFLLAEAGLLDGRRATTHWAACEPFAARYPSISVEPDRIHVKDGRVYTSAGVTAGMDLALALVQEDLGREAALAVARWLVVFLKRPGGQSQFSAQLAAQLAESEPIREVQGWIQDHPGGDLSVPGLARRCGMSPRNFARVFVREVGATPARYVEAIRVESARRLLEDSRLGVDQVAERCGFGTAESMRRAFLRTVRVAPSEYRNRFRAAEGMIRKEESR